MFSRYLFHKRDQRDGETIDQYITELKLLARKCEYSTTDLKEEMIRDRLVCGISSARVREKLLQAGSNLTLSQAVTISRAHVETQVQLRTMSQPGSSSIHGGQDAYIEQEVDFIRKGKKTNQSAQAYKQCYFCGEYSPLHKCPAKGKACSNCDELNHFAKVCKSNRKTVNLINQEACRNKDDDIFIDTVNIIDSVNMDKGEDQPYVKLMVNGRARITFKIDTGAQANIIPERNFKTLKPKPVVRETLQILTSFGGQKIPTLGVCNLTCTYTNDSSESQPFFI